MLYLKSNKLNYCSGGLSNSCCIEYGDDCSYITSGKSPVTVYARVSGIVDDVCCGQSRKKFNGQSIFIGDYYLLQQSSGNEYVSVNNCQWLVKSAGSGSLQYDYGDTSFPSPALSVIRYYSDNCTNYRDSYTDDNSYGWILSVAFYNSNFIVNLNQAVANSLNVFYYQQSISGSSNESLLNGTYNNQLSCSSAYSVQVSGSIELSTTPFV